MGTYMQCNTFSTILRRNVMLEKHYLPQVIKLLKLYIVWNEEYTGRMLLVRFNVNQ